METAEPESEPSGPSAPGPEIPASGLPEPDLTPAEDLDKQAWQIVSLDYGRVSMKYGLCIYNTVYTSYLFIWRGGGVHCQHWGVMCHVVTRYLLINKYINISK